MSLRPPAGFIRPGYDPLKNPDAPTIGTATGGDASASVAFTAPGDAGGSAITAYYAVSNPGQITGTAASSPVSVTGLTNGTAYTFQVWALNSYGPGPWSAASGSVTPVGQIGLFAGGIAHGGPISYINIATTGNAAYWGDYATSTTFQLTAGCANSTRGLYGGQNNGDNNTIQYVTFASQGNAQDFGDLIGSNPNYGLSAVSNSTRGIWAGGVYGSFNTIQYVTIASTSNTSYFGDLIANGKYLGGSTCSSTRGVFVGGFNNSYSRTSTMQYITIASTGDATNFGNLLGTYVKLASGNISSGTRGVFAAGTTDNSTPFNTIQYITIASTGNATDFGDLTYAAREVPAACGSTVRGIVAGGYTGGGTVNIINYITIASVGNATDFGDLITVTERFTGFSNCHGGL